MANQIKYQVGFDIQKEGLNQLKSSLQQIQKLKISDVMKINNTDAASATETLRQVKTQATNVENALKKAFNTKLNTLNIEQFNKTLKNSGSSISQVQQAFSQVGAAGQAAFNNVATQILNTNVQLRQSNKLLDSMATSMANTVKWSITSSIVNNITQSIQNAYYYAKDLDRSLTDIRIVTGDSADQMQRFANTANSAAKDLGRSTLDYTKAALAFYQQGLSDDQVQARTSVTLKAENITGIGSDMVDYLTSVWNGFNVSAEQSEEYVDKLAAVADTTASNMGQLATAISKVASTANAMGVDIDQLNGQIATVIATTRQAPESVGVAFKTIYARMNDIKTGADEAQVSLGNYSGKMAALGFNVLDANGHLRDTGEVIEEIGGRWESLTKEQQINLAQTMAGQRQYNNLIALFDNWDKYLQSVNTSLNAQGTLNEKNDRYLESLEAHMIELGTEAERTYDILFNEKAVKGWVDAFSGALGVFNDFIEGLGGGGTALTYFGSLVASIFNKQIAQAIQGVGTQLERFKANLAGVAGRQKMIEQIKSGLKIEYAGQGQSLGNNALTVQAEAAEKTLAVQRGLTMQQQKQAVQIQRQIGLEAQRTEDLKQKLLSEQEENRLARERLGLNTQEKVLNDKEIQDLQESLQYSKQRYNTYQNILSIFTQTQIALGESKNDENQKNLLAAQFQRHQQEIYQAYIKSGGELKNWDDTWKAIIQEIKAGENSLENFSDVQALIREKSEGHKNIFEQIEILLRNHKNRTQQQLQVSQRVTKEYQKQNDILAQHGRKTINLQNMVRGLASAGQILSSWAGSAKVFGDQLATAEQKANALTSSIQGTISGIGSFFGPIGMGISTLLNGTISLTKELFWGDALEQHYKTTKEKIQELNDAINQVNQNNKTKNAQIANLQQVAEEYQKLSEKAGAYGVNLDQLTQDQQDRYHEITDSFTEYNQAVIIGYDEQGHAIVRGQEALKETIKVLKQAKREADLAALGDKDILGTISGQHEQEQAKKQQIYNNARRERAAAGIARNSDIELSANKYPIPAPMDFRNFLMDVNNKVMRPMGMDYYNNIFDFISNSDMVDWTEKMNLGKLPMEAYNGGYGGSLNFFVQQIKSNLELEKDQLLPKEITDTLIEIAKNNGIDSDTLDYLLNGLNQQIKTIIDERQTRVKEAEDALSQAETNLNKKENYTEEQARDFLVNLNKENADLYYGILDKAEDLGLNWNQGDLFSLLAKEIVNTVYDEDHSTEVVYAELQARAQNLYDTLVKSGELLGEAQSKSIEDIEKILINNSDQTSGQIYNALLNSINRIWFDNPDIQQMLNDPERKDMVLNLIKSLYGLDDLVLQTEDGKSAVFAISNAATAMGKQVASALNDSIEQSISASDSGDTFILDKWLRDTFSDEQISRINQQINNLKPSFKTLEEAKQWIQDFLDQDANDDNVNNIIKNFDKVSSAIQKIQSGKDLSYKEKTNLLSSLYEGQIDPSKLQDTEQLLKHFEEAVLTTSDSMQRAEGLSILATSFEKLQQLKSKIDPAEYKALWSDIFDQEIKQLNLTEDELEQFAKANNIAFNSSQTKQAALNLYKESENLGKLEKAVDSAKNKIKEYKSIQNAIKDSQTLNHLKTLHELLASLGINVDYQWIIDNIDGLTAAIKNDTIEIDNLVKTAQNLNGSEPVNFDQKKTTSQNLKGAYEGLSNDKTLTTEQSNALNELLTNNETLNKLYLEQGANSEVFLGILKQIVQLTDSQILNQQRIKQIDSEIQSKKQQQLRLQNNIQNGADITQAGYTRARNITDTATLFTPNQVDQAQDTVNKYEARQKALQKIGGVEEDINNLIKQRLGLESENNEIMQQRIDKMQTIDQLETAKSSGKVSDKDFKDNLDKVAGKEAKSLGLKEDQVLDYADALQEMADQADYLADSLEEDRDAALQVAIANKRMSRGIDDLAKNFEKYQKQLNSDNIEQFAQGLASCRAAMGDLLNIDGDQLSGAFFESTQNLEDMQLAAQGDTEAIDRLRASAAQDIIQNCEVYLEGDQYVQARIRGMAAEIQAYLGQDFEVGVNIDDTQFINACNRMISEANMTEKQIQSYFNSLGYDPKITYEDVPQTSTTDTAGSITIGPWGPVPEFTVPYNASATNTTQIKVPKIEALTKIGGGSSSSPMIHTPSSSGGSGGSRGKGGGKGRGGGGSGKSAEPNKDKKDKKKKIEDERDIYHDINIQIEKINRNLDRAQKKQDHLYGKDLLDNLRQQSKLLEEQNKKLEKKLALQKQDLASQQKALKKLGVIFDAYGNIANYMKIVGKYQNQVNNKTDKYNKLVKEYNKETNKNKKDKLKERLQKLDKQVNKASDSLQKLKDKIKNYDELREEIEDSKDNINDTVQEQIEKNVQTFRTTIEVHLDMSAAQRDWNDFYRNVIDRTDVVKDSNFDKIFADAAKSSKDFFSYFGNGDTAGSIETITNQLIKTQAEIEKINRGESSDIYGKDKEKALENLKTDLASLQDQLEGMLASVDEVDQAYLSTIDEIDNQFNKQMQNYGFVEQLLTHDMDLLSLLYGDQNYEAMDKYYTQLNENSNKQIDFLKQQAAWWKERWQAAVNAGDTNAAEKFEQHYRQTIGNLNSMIEQSIQTIQDKYINSINKIFDELDRRISDGKGSDFVEKEWDLLNKNADEYYDTINAAFALQDLRGQFDKAINSTKDLKNQQALKRLMDEQLTNLENKDKLTEYDVERAQKLLELEQARIALEDAQAAKTTMRLKRDSQGNYSYEYIADDDDILQTQRRLAQLNNDLYNFDKERYNANLSDALQAWKEFQSQYKAIMSDMSKSQEDQARQAALLQQQYAEYINGKLTQNEVIRGNLTDSALQDYALLNNEDAKHYKNLSVEEKDLIMKDLVPTWDSGIQAMIDAMTKEGGFVPTCQQAFEKVSEASKEYKNDVKETADSAGTDFEKTKEGVSALAEQTSKLITTNDALMTNMDKEMTKVANLRDYIHSLANAYKEVTRNAMITSGTIHDLLQQTNLKSANDTNDFNKINDKSIGLGTWDTAKDQVLNGLNQADSTVYGSQLSGMMQIFEDSTMDSLSNDERINRLNERVSTMAIILEELKTSLEGSLYSRADNIKGGFSNLFDGANGESIEQTVNIEAVFPNVNTRKEIEDAFYELANMAIQRALRN